METLRGKYRIIREIARSNDIVYEAEDVTCGRRVAIKELNIAPGMTGQLRSERVERFRREAEATRRLRHRNIVSIYEYGEENGRHFIVMEYLEGQNLRDHLQTQRVLSLQEALNIAYQVLDALAFAHERGVVHRDIKPDNIHILPGGQVKLTDFGIARLTDQPALTNDGQIFGTPSYMSPEQVIGREIDHRSDLFSVGVVLYEMLTGRRPFTGDSVISITYAIMHFDPPPMSGIPAAVEQVIRRALCKDPSGRPETAEEMRNALQRAERAPVTYLPAANVSGSGYGGGVSGPWASISPPAPYPNPYPAGGGAYPVAPYGSPGMGCAPSLPVAPPYPHPLGQPWPWNTPGAASAGVPPTAMAPVAGAPLQTPAGVPASSGGQVPAWATSRDPWASWPVIRITPAQRTTLIAIGLAILLGIGLAGIVIGFLRAYQIHLQQSSVQQAVSLINQGVQEYNARRYVEAVRLFEQALAQNPSARERQTIRFNLVSAYVQLARVAESEGRWQDAEAAYRAALEVDAYNRLAREGLAAVLERMGRGDEARSERELARSGLGGTGTPAELDTVAASADGMESVPADPDAFLTERMQRAQQLIAEGDALYRRGDVEQARAKWRDAVREGAGTAMRDEANNRLAQTESGPPQWSD
ncbi:MAG: protein kinase [Chthonomonadaceae bacterium]|nr:protein kinase [Chthonomonadaceae bacterium]